MTGPFLVLTLSVLLQISGPSQIAAQRHRVGTQGTSASWEPRIS